MGCGYTWPLARTCSVVPARDQHIQRALENEAFFRDRLDLSQEIDRSWAVVTLFYAALHWVDAYLATKNIHPAAHQVRDRYVGTALDLRRIGVSYQTLEDRSRDARYQLLSFTLAQVLALEGGHFVPVRDHIKRLLGVP